MGDNILRQLELDFMRLLPESTAVRNRGKADSETGRHQVSEVGVAVFGLENRIIKEFERD
jgi:hypothetical protein